MLDRVILVKIFTIQGLHCRNCAGDLERELASLPKGDQIKIDYEAGQISLPKESSIDQVSTVLEANKLILQPLQNQEEGEAGTPDHHPHGQQVQLGRSSKMLLVFALNFVFAIIEFVFGSLFHSAAIMSDAVHDLGDSFSIGLAYFFEKISTKEADAEFTFGYSRFSLLGALLTSTFLILGAVFMLFHSIPLVFNPQVPNYEGMFWLAIGAILVNGFSSWLLSRGQSSNEKMLSLHTLEDLLGWIAVLLVSLILRYTDWYFLDPLLSVGIAIFILYHALPSFIESIKTFLNSSPSEIDVDGLEERILSIEGVHGVRHLHVFSIDGQENVFNVTAFVSTQNGQEMNCIRRQIIQALADYNPVHYTVELVPDLEKLIQ